METPNGLGSRKKAIRTAVMAVAAIVMAVLVSNVLPPSFLEPARRMAFVFVIAAAFWSLEIIPLHATAILVIVLEIILLGKWAGSARPGIPYIQFMEPLGSPVIMLFLGGFVLATAARKYGIDKLLASRLIPLFGKRPFLILLGLAATTGFFALWMSATATSAMMLAVVSPLLAQLDADDPFRKGLVLSIPFGARVGSVGTPVATPPNAIAVGMLKEQGHQVDFSSWMAIGVPLAVVVLILSVVALYLVFRPRHASVEFNIPKSSSITGRAKATIGIALGTVLLWVTSKLHGLPDDVVSLIGITCFLGSGLLDREDLKRIDWDILILMWGGLALGEGLKQTGLAEQIVNLPMFANSGPYALAIFCVLAMLISTFLSNTTSANLLLPLAASFPATSPYVLPIAVALACSFDIPLPVSSPPNALAFSTNEVSVGDMLKAGAPVTLLIVFLIILAGPHVIGLVFR